MKTLTAAQLEKTVKGATVENIEKRRGYVNVIVDLGDELIKQIAVKADSEAAAKEKALEVITDEPEGIRGFILKTEK